MSNSPVVAAEGCDLVRSGSVLCAYPFDALRLFTGSALTAANFCQTATKVSKKALPHRSAFASLRFPRAGPAPWARRDGPSLAQRGSPGIHAGRPTTQNLHSASQKGRVDQDHKPDQKRFAENSRFGFFDLKITSAATRLRMRLKGPSQQAERRCCYGGIPAWMPGELRRAKDGPSQRAPITVPE